MSGLNQQQREQLASGLRERERALYADIRRELDKDERYVDNSGEVPDPGDASLADLIADLQQAEVGRDLGELRAVGQALQRLQSEGYGLCLDCGTDIPFARLQAQPEALRCIDCQNNWERHHAGAGRGPTL